MEIKRFDHFIKKHSNPFEDNEIWEVREIRENTEGEKWYKMVYENKTLTISETDLLDNFVEYIFEF